MKNFTKILLCAMVLMTIAFLPEIIETLNLPDAGMCLAAGPGFAALNWKSGQNNMGGFKDYILFVPADAVSKIPTPPTNPDSNIDLVTAEGSFVFRSNGSAPVYIYCTKNTVKYSAPTQGEADGISFALSGEFFFPGNKKEMHAFNALIKNTPGYLVIEDSDGEQIIVGQPGLYATIKPSFEGGQAKADRRGTKYEFSADSNYSALFLGTPIDISKLSNSVIEVGDGNNNSGGNNDGGNSGGFVDPTA